MKAITGNLQPNVVGARLGATYQQERKNQRQMSASDKWHRIKGSQQLRGQRQGSSLNRVREQMYKQMIEHNTDKSQHDYSQSKDNLQPQPYQSTNQHHQNQQEQQYQQSRYPYHAQFQSSNQNNNNTDKFYNNNNLWHLSSVSKLSTQQLNSKEKKIIYVLDQLQGELITQPRQYRDILGKLAEQNVLLKSDLKLLRGKVEQLKSKQIIKERQRERQQQIQEMSLDMQFKKSQEQLKSKLKLLQRLKRKTDKNGVKFVLQLQSKQCANKLTSLSTQTSTLASQLRDQKIINKKLKKSIKHQQSNSFKSCKQVFQIQTYNKQLRTKICLAKKVISTQEQLQRDIHMNIAQIKDKQRKLNWLMKKQLLGKINFTKDPMENNKLRKLSRFKTEIATNQYTEDYPLQSDQICKKIIPHTYLQTNNSKQVSDRLSLLEFQSFGTKVRAKTQFSLENRDAEDNQNQNLKKSRTLKHFQEDKPNDLIALPLESSKITSLSKEQINKLAMFLRIQTQNTQKSSAQIKQRILTLQRFLDSNYKRSGSKLLISKQKDMILAENNILLQQLKNTYNKKIEVLREYNTLRKGYSPQQNLQAQQHENKDRNANPLDQQQVDVDVSQKNINIFEVVNQLNVRKRSKSQMKRTKGSVEKLQNPSLRPMSSTKKESIHQSSITNKFKNLELIQCNGNTSKSIHNIQNQPKQTKTSSQKQQLALIKYEDKQIQTYFQVSNQYLVNNKRKWKQEYIGELDCDNIDFDDRIYSSFEQKMYINEITVYHSMKGIYFIKARYKPMNKSYQIHGALSSHHHQTNAPKQNFIQTQLSFKLPFNFQDKFKNSDIKQSTTQLSINDYIKQVKLYYKYDRKYIAKIQIMSKYNIKYEFGNKDLVFPTLLKPFMNVDVRENAKEVPKDNRRSKQKVNYQTKKQDKQINKITDSISCANKFYQFDITDKYYPSFMFGNYTYVDGETMLKGIGFVINRQQQ